MFGYAGFGRCALSFAVPMRRGAALSDVQHADCLEKRVSGTVGGT